MRAFVNGIAMDFDLVGSGPTLVLIHALGVDRRMWQRQVAAFAEAHQVVAYDVRGHGRSDRPMGPYTLELLADDLRGLLDALGVEMASLLGLSMGGMIAQTFALAYPQLVDRLILADTTSEYPADGRRQFEERAKQVEASGTEPLVQPTLERWFTPEFRADHDEEVQAIGQILLSTDPIGYAGACLAVSRVDLTGRLGSITAPTLVLVGEHDPGTPVAAATRIRDAIPGARLEVIQGASHLSNVARPEAFDDLVLAFLSEREQPPDVAEDVTLDGAEIAEEVAADLTAEAPPAAPTALPEAGVGSPGEPEHGYPEGPRTDQQVTDGVLAAYFLVPDLKARQFRVETVDGVVRLGGKVGSEDERRRALDIAAGVAGVDRVIDELEVE